MKEIHICEECTGRMQHEKEGWFCPNYRADPKSHWLAFALDTSLLKLMRAKMRWRTRHLG